MKDDKKELVLGLSWDFWVVAFKMIIIYGVSCKKMNYWYTKNNKQFRFLFSLRERQTESIKPTCMYTQAQEQALKL